MKKIRELNFYETACALGHDLGHGAFNMTMGFEINRKLDVEILKNAIRYSFESHLLLRAILFFEENHYIFIENNDFNKVCIKVAECDKMLEECFSEEQDTRFCNSESLIRFRVIKKHETDLFLMSMHHGLGDGMSMWKIIREIFNSYLKIQKNEKVILKSMKYDKSLEDVVESEVSKLGEIIENSYNKEFILNKYVQIEERSTGVQLIHIEKNEFKKIVIEAKKMGITVNSFLTRNLFESIVNMLKVPSEITINTPFNLFTQFNVIEHFPDTDFGNGVGMIVQKYKSDDYSTFCEWSMKFEKELKEKIKVYKIPKLSVDNFLSAKHLIETLIEQSSKGTIPLDFMHSNIGKVTLHSELDSQIKGMISGGGRRMGDQVLLVVPISIDGELYVSVSFTRPFISDEWVHEFVKNYKNNYRRVIG